MANKNLFYLELDEHTVLVCDDALHYANLMKQLEDRFGKLTPKMKRGGGDNDVKQIEEKS